jgi:MFS transporter, DHA2 family, multidrug resistance protein
MSLNQSTTSPAPASARSVTPFTLRLFIGFLGILISAMMAGLGNRVGALALGDMRGVLGLGADEGSWLNTVYLAGELIAMPFSIWLSTIISLRRFHLLMTGLYALFAVVFPLVHNWPFLLLLRSLQGLVGGMLIPVLMMAAMRLFPVPIRLYGLSLYALSVTFSPNLGFWLAGHSIDVLTDWRLFSWQSLPLALLAMAMVYWGIPQDPVRLERLRQTDWFGMFCGVCGLGMIAVGLDQGVRRDWWHSGLICWMVGGGVIMAGIFTLSQWFAPVPFVKPQLLLQKRNLGVGFTVLALLIIVMMSGSKLPAMHLESLWGYRNLQSAPIGLLVGLPQPLLGLAVAALLYQKWADARIVMALGIAFIAVACFLSARLTSDWVIEQFVLALVLEAFGQAMAIVAVLFLATSVVQPIEGQFVAGAINMMRASGSLVGNALIDQFFHLRQNFHSGMLVDRIGRFSGALSLYPGDLAALTDSTRQQAFVMANADSYLMLGVLAVLLIPFVLRMDYVAAPARKSAVAHNSSAKG